MVEVGRRSSSPSRAKWEMSAWLSTWLLGADVTYGGSVANRLDFSATWHLEISYRLDSTRTLNFWREDEASNIWREIAGSYSYHAYPATATSEPLRAQEQLSVDGHIARAYSHAQRTARGMLHA